MRSCHVRRCRVMYGALQLSACRRRQPRRFSIGPFSAIDARHPRRVRRHHSPLLGTASCAEQWSGGKARQRSAADGPHAIPARWPVPVAKKPDAVRAAGPAAGAEAAATGGNCARARGRPAVARTTERGSLLGFSREPGGTSKGPLNF